MLTANVLPYSTFYDGRDATHLELCQALGLIDEEGEPDEWYSAEHLVDLAAAQLEEQGIVRIQPITTKLADGNDDYLIELTADGRARLSAGFKPSYPDME